MKKIKILVLAIIVNFVFATVCMADIITVYPTDEPTIVKTKLDNHTYITFQTTIVTASTGSKDLFSAVTDNLTNKIKITPLKYGVSTNLIVFTADGEQYEFWLQEIGDKNEKFYGIVNVVARPNVEIADLINMLNKRKVAIDPAIKKLINFYEVTEPAFTSYQNINIYLKRAATIKNLNKTIYWIRLENTSDKYLTITSMEKEKIEKEEYYIPINKFQVKSRLISWIAIESNKEILRTGDFTDIYLVIQGDYLDPSLDLIFNCNNKDVEVRIGNIPYTRQEFRVFIAENNNYTTVTIDDYWR